MNASGRRQLRTHFLVFAQQSYSKTATTELPALSGIPFARVGARIADLRGGVEATPKKHLSITASYNFQWIDFNNDPQLGAALLGGHSNGAAAGAKYQLGERTWLTADYDLQRAHLLDGNQFTVQNWWAGGDHRLTENSHAYGALGISHVHGRRQPGADIAGLAGGLRPAPRKGRGRPELRAVVRPVVRRRRHAVKRGGHLEPARAFWAQDVCRGECLVAQQRTTLVAGDIPSPLRSLWIGGLVGYAAQPWLRIEGFYGRTQQRSTDLAAIWNATASVSRSSPPNP